jgi:hypothetical protein
MAAYLARGIMEGRLNYSAVFSISLYTKYKADVDAILVAEGRQELITA